MSCALHSPSCAATSSACGEIRSRRRKSAGRRSTISRWRSITSTGLVDDLLLLARSDSGTVELRRDPVDLAEVAGEALQRLRPLAESRGVILSLDAAPATVTGDADRLRQLVAILVDNAIRHSSAGGTVHVSISPAGRPSIRVDDEGQGIRPEDLPNVFERFYRASDAPSGGTGLGLAIAAWIADHHGGVIRAFNRREGGARFEVQLPPA